MKIEIIKLDEPDSTSSDDSSSDFDSVLDDVLRKSKRIMSVGSIKKIKQSDGSKKHKNKVLIKKNHTNSSQFDIVCSQISGLNFELGLLKVTKSKNEQDSAKGIIEHTNLNKIDKKPLSFFTGNDYKCQHSIFEFKMYGPLKRKFFDFIDGPQFGTHLLDFKNNQSFNLNDFKMNHIDSVTIQFIGLAQNNFSSNIFYHNPTSRSYRVLFKNMRYLFKIKGSLVSFEEINTDDGP